MLCAMAAGGALVRRGNAVACITAIAVNVLMSEPTRKTVSSVTAVFEAMPARVSRAQRRSGTCGR